jgi:segregation and condensation protein A
MEKDFAIKVGEFEGPLDLLLALIEKKKMHISEVSLAQVTEDYISHLQQFADEQNKQMGKTADFILIASTLMLIKSLSLLPSLSLTPEESESVNDLEYRLKLLQLFKDLGAHIKDRFNQQVIFYREPNKNVQIVFSPTKEISLENLLAGAKTVINNLPKKEILPKTTIKKIISLEEVIENLTQRVQSALRMKFSDFASVTKKDKITVVICFLGMLELVKQGIIEAKQDNLFNDIEMETKQVAVPRIN